MTMEQLISTLINILKVTITTLLVLLVTTIIKNTYIDIDNHISSKKIEKLDKVVQEQEQSIIMLNNYINWKECIDSSNADCQVCDSLYNSDGEFVY